MDSAKIDELERLAKVATPGPWKDKSFRRYYDWGVICSGGKRIAQCTSADVTDERKRVTFKEKLANAAFIAAARNAEPYLIAENRALRERVRELEEMSGRAIDEAGYLLGCMPTLDCRVCDYHGYCPEPMPGYEPDIETCRAAMRIFCDPKGAQISEKVTKEVVE